MKLYILTAASLITATALSGCKSPQGYSAKLDSLSECVESIRDEVKNTGFRTTIDRPDMVAGKWAGGDWYCRPITTGTSGSYVEDYYTRN